MRAGLHFAHIDTSRIVGAVLEDTTLGMTPALMILVEVITPAVMSHIVVIIAAATMNASIAAIVAMIIAPVAVPVVAVPVVTLEARRKLMEDFLITCITSTRK